MAEADLRPHAWPAQHLGEALEALARASGLGPAATEPLRLPAALRPALGAAGEIDAPAPAELDGWLVWAAARLGLEAEAVDGTVPQVAGLLRQAAPALLWLRPEPGAAPAVLLLLGRRGGRLRLLGPDGRVRVVALAALRDALCAEHEVPVGPEIDRLLDAAAVPPRRRARARAALLDARLAEARVAGCWLLRQPAGAGFGAQLRQAGLPQRLGVVLALFALVYTLEIAGWQLIGRAALDGRLDAGWLAAWAGLVLSVVPLQTLGGWLEARIALDTGALLKQRLLAGAMRLDLDALRRQGAGQLLGRVMESQALESLALNGGLGVLVSGLELLFAGWILSMGAAPLVHGLLLAAALTAVALLAWRFDGRQRAWTQRRSDLTQALVEGMVGHRTRLAQDRPARREAEDDRALQAYLDDSAAMDRAAVPIVALAPRGWLLLGLAGLAPAFLGGSAGPGALAISLGGILFAHRALGGLAGGFTALARAGIAWRQVADTFRAGAQPPAGGRWLADADWAADTAGTATVDAQQLAYAYPGAAEPVLRGASLALQPGDQVLLEGASGGGKSTLAALLVGLRPPRSGLLLLRGLDAPTLGEAWQRGATEAPQFHENHVLGGSLAFNLLMGRQWPAAEADLAEARALCEELGLGDLLARMPAGLMQTVGETGWQLSHGERSRLFLARALLQRAPLTLLDESFAALDPHTLRQCLDTARRHARTLVVIAHP